MKLKAFIAACTILYAYSVTAQLSYIDTSFENASPLYWERAEDGSIQVYLVYDLERDAPNRANGHWHFKLEGTPGTRVHMVLNNLLNIWNGKPGVPVSTTTVCKASKYLADMERYEALMRKHTWFTEGHTGGSFHNPGSFGEGLLERYGITAFVQELNANWIEGLQQDTGGENWELLGSQLRKVFYEYFE